MLALPIYNTDITDAIPTANFTPLLSPEKCQDIIDSFRLDKGRQAETPTAKEHRKNHIHPIPFTEDSQWLFELIADRVGRANMVEFQFNVSGLYNDLQLLEYNEGDHYDWHIDIGPGEAAYRKLSVIIQLTDPEEYEGGEVVFNAGTERDLPRDQGQIAVFPSFILHKVNPVTKGTRYSLVTWAQGHERFK